MTCVLGIQTLLATLDYIALLFMLMVKMSKQEKLLVVTSDGDSLFSIIPRIKIIGLKKKKI